MQMIATLRQGVVRAREQLVQKEAEFTRANARLAEVSRHPSSICRYVYDVCVCVCVCVCVFTRANARLAEVSRQIWPSHMLACMHPDCRVYDLSICESMYMDRSASIT